MSVQTEVRRYFQDQRSNGGAPTVILGSGSPRRKQIFEFLDLDFTVISPGVDETPLWRSMVDQPGGWGFRSRLLRTLETTVLAKSKGVIDQITHQKRLELLERPIFCFDTIVTEGSLYLGKPQSRALAETCLRSLSGKVHEVISGCLVSWRGTHFYKAYHTKVKFHDLTESRIHRYLELEDVSDASGSYKIQGKGLSLVKEIKGSYHNVMGLPIEFMNLFQDPA